MLRSFDFLQGHTRNLKICLHPHYLSGVNQKESETESEDIQLPKRPQFLKSIRNYSYIRLRKTAAWLEDRKRVPQNKATEQLVINAGEEHKHQFVFDGRSNWSEVKTAAEKEVWPVEDSEPSQSSQDSTTSSFDTGSSVEKESFCSTCEDQKESEDGSPGRDVLDLPPPGSGILIGDPMLGDFPTAWKKQFTASSVLPESPILVPRTPLREADSLNLSLSLLTSPSRDMSHTLFPEGQNELRTLFKDVWVTPESTILNDPSLSYSLANDSLETVMRTNGGNLSSETEEDNKGSRDETWITKRLIPLKKSRQTCSPGGIVGRSHVKTQENPKRKCVNGFIMFCRMNRKLYISSHPGTPSTTVTKELANLWHIMPKQERRVYCLKAWRFSRQHNRNVRAEGQGREEREREAEECVPSPLHILLAHKDRFAAVKQRS